PRVHRAAYAASPPAPQMEYAQPAAAQAYQPQPGYGAPSIHQQAAYHAQQPVVPGPPPQAYGPQPNGYVPASPAQAPPAGGYAPGAVAMHDPNVMPAQYTVPGVPAVPGVGVPGAVPAAAPTGVGGCFAGLCQIGSQLKSCW